MLWRKSISKLLMIALILLAFPCRSTLAGGDFGFCVAQRLARIVDGPRKATNPPVGVPYIALGRQTAGHNKGLSTFMDFMKKTLAHPVTNYWEMSSTGYVRPNEYNNADPDGVLALLEVAFRKTMKAAPRSKVILFNLDGLDLEGFRFELDTVTGRELNLIVSNRAYFEATRFYRDGVEQDPRRIWEEIEQSRQRDKLNKSGGF